MKIDGKSRKMKSVFAIAILLASFFIIRHFAFRAGVYPGQYAAGIESLELAEYQTALELLLPLAERGDAYAQWQVGEIYQQGLGVKKDDTEAAKWYRKAFQTLQPQGERGSAEGQYLVSRMYHGKGVEANLAEAEKWLRMAADHGDFTAQSYLSSLYQLGQIAPPDLKRGDVVKPDWVQAYKWGYLSMGENGVLKHIAGNMTPEQIAEAKRLISEWKKAHPAIVVPRSKPQ
ncbi:MAG: tetratricopeptide repeat protein [Alphaproteobacteria bacterium]